jgi:hypothetical protein
MEEQKRCQAITSNGQQCANTAKPGEDFCGIHLPKEAEEIRSALPDKSLLPGIKIIQRYIAVGTPQGGSVMVDDLQSYISSFLKLGYKLFNTHYIGQTPEGLGVIFILVL